VSSSDRSPLELDEARRRLRELGYLNGRVERFLFRRAFEGRGGLLLPAAVIGAAGAALAAVASVESADPAFGGSGAGAALAVALLHLFVADLAVALVVSLPVGAWADRSRSPEAAATGAGLAAAGLLFLLWIGGVYGLAREVPAAAMLWGIPLAIAALFLARSVRSGFLARAYVRSRLVPARPRRRVFLAAAVAGVLMAVALFASRSEPVPVAAPRPSPRPVSVVVVAIDGLNLDAAGAESLTGIRALFAKGATGWWLEHPASPPEIWTDIATGEPARRHGVRALERVRPAGSPLALRPPFGTSWYLRGIGPALGLVETAPVSARDRRSLAFWEVAASAGLPAAAVGWWASGRWPGADVAGNEEVLQGATDGAAADRRAIELFFGLRKPGQALQTVYLPGLDILRKDPRGHAADAAVIQRFLEDEISRAAPRGDALVVIAADSHPSPGALGRMIVYDGPHPVTTVRIRPEDAAPSILARAGVPVARDLPGRPAAALFRPATLETAAVATYGPRVLPASARSARTDREYLEKLKSLGYLQ
jgi:hypothetical protein